MKPDEIKIGPFTFEYDFKRHEMYISQGEEALGMVETAPRNWKAFVNAYAEVEIFTPEATP